MTSAKSRLSALDGMLEVLAGHCNSKAFMYKAHGVNGVLQAQLSENQGRRWKDFLKVVVLGAQWHAHAQVCSDMMISF